MHQTDLDFGIFWSPRCCGAAPRRGSERATKGGVNRTRSAAGPLLRPIAQAMGTARRSRALRTVPPRLHGGRGGGVPPRFVPPRDWLRTRALTACRRVRTLVRTSGPRSAEGVSGPCSFPSTLPYKVVGLVPAAPCVRAAPAAPAVAASRRGVTRMWLRPHDYGGGGCRGAGRRAARRPHTCRLLGVTRFWVETGCTQREIFPSAPGLLTALHKALEIESSSALLPPAHSLLHTSCAHHCVTQQAPKPRSFAAARPPAQQPRVLGTVLCKVPRNARKQRRRARS